MKGVLLVFGMITVIACLACCDYRKEFSDAECVALYSDFQSVFAEESAWSDNYWFFDNEYGIIALNGNIYVSDEGLLDGESTTLLEKFELTKGLINAVFECPAETHQIWGYDAIGTAKFIVINMAEKYIEEYEANVRYLSAAFHNDGYVIVMLEYEVDTAIYQHEINLLIFDGWTYKSVKSENYYPLSGQ